MRTENNGQVSKYQFDSLVELSNYLLDAPRTWSDNQSKTTQASQRWDLGTGYSRAVELARDGWLAGAQRMERTLATLPPKDAAPDTVTDFYGHLPHVARYCAGAPDSMIRHSREGQSGSGRILTLYVPVCANANADAPNMANFALGVAMAIDALEAQGTRVELYGMLITQGHYPTRSLSHAWRIKSADQPIDLVSLAFSVGHPAMFRRLGFGLYERSDVQSTPGYGQVREARLSDLIDPPSGAYIINGMRQCNTVAATPAKAQEYVMAQLSKMVETQDAE